jgi:hypothetical protein
MIKKIALPGVLLIFAIMLPSFALLNGISVTTMRTYCSNDWRLQMSYTYGHIVKFTITNGAVVKTDTLYKSNLAGYPALNIQGNKVAFIRKDGQKVNKYLSLMDVNGNNVRDLDTFPGYYQDFDRRAIIDWPAGDWIYYNKKGADLVAPDDVWKVNINDLSTQQHVFTYKNYTSFSLSLDATKASITASTCSNASAWYCNVPHVFPPASEPSDNWPTAVSYGCGSYISPSGNYHVHFQDQAHTIIGVNTLNWSSRTATATFDIRQNPTMAQWANLPQDTVGAGKMWYPRWAVNSDKWICALAGDAYPKSNYHQLLVNWVDHQAIVTPDGPELNEAICKLGLGDQMERNCEAGDLWVAGGPCGSYEDVNGAWIATSVSSGCGASGLQPLTRSVSTLFLASDKVDAYTVQGRFLCRLDKKDIIRRKSLSISGAYIIKPISAINNGIARISIVSLDNNLP